MIYKRNRRKRKNEATAAAPSPPAVAVTVAVEVVAGGKIRTHTHTHLEIPIGFIFLCQFWISTEERFIMGLFIDCGLNFFSSLSLSLSFSPLLLTDWTETLYVGYIFLVHAEKSKAREKVYEGECVRMWVRVESLYFQSIVNHQGHKSPNTNSLALHITLQYIYMCTGCFETHARLFWTSFRTSNPTEKSMGAFLNSDVLP